MLTGRMKAPRRSWRFWVMGNILRAGRRLARGDAREELIRSIRSSSRRKRCLRQRLLEVRVGRQPRAGAVAELVGDDLAVLDHDVARRARFAGKLIEDRLEIARPVALLVGLAQLRRIDFGVGAALVLGRGKPG